MDLRIVRASQWLIISTMVIGICHGRSVSLTGPSGVQQGATAVFTCSTSGMTSPYFGWFDTGRVMYFGTARFNNAQKYDNFEVSIDGTTSTLTISDAAFEDDGSYYCSVSGTQSNTIDFIVEVKSNVTLEVNTTVVNNTVMYEATCEAIGARPEENITWYIGNVTQTMGVVETDPDLSHHTLWDKRSIFTFPANKENYNQTLTCRVSGHEVADFNWLKVIQLDFHDPPASDNIKVTFTIKGSNMTVSCDLDESKGRPTPAITNYYIFANDELVLGSTQGENVVRVPVPDGVTEFRCLAGNYLGNATNAVTYEPPTYEPPRGDVISEITDFMDDLPFASKFSSLTGGQVLSIIVGITIVAVVSIVINIVQWYIKK